MRVFQGINKNIIATAIIQTPLGDMFAASTRKGICMLTFYESKEIEVHIKRLKKFFDSEIISAQSPLFVQLQQELDEYFEGKREHFDVPLQIVGTPFEQKVWKIVMAIPYGQTIFYENLAQLINQPKALSAVSKANTRNMLQVIVPCHRVIKKSGIAGNYIARKHKKVYLLKHETCPCAHNEK
jgi:O-6-methylguanine DNA methyltransferase